MTEFDWIFLGVGILTTVVGMKFLPDAIRIIQKKEPKDITTVNAFARRFADIGDHQNQKSENSIYLITTFLLLLTGIFGILRIIILLMETK